MLVSRSLDLVSGGTLPPICPAHTLFTFICLVHTSSLELIWARIYILSIPYSSLNIHDFKNSRWGILGECTAVCTTVWQGCCSTVLRSHGPSSRSASEKLPRAWKVRLSRTTRVCISWYLSFNRESDRSEKVGWVAKLGCKSAACRTISFQVFGDAPRSGWGRQAHYGLFNGLSKGLQESDDQ